MTILSVFKNHIPNCSYIFKSGKAAAFLNGRFVTGIKTEIDELEAEIANAHQYIFKDVNELTVDTEALSPLETLMKQEYDKAYAQAKADLISAGNYLDPAKSTTTSQAPFNSSVANTLNVQEGAAGSDSTNAGATASNVNTSASTTGAQLMSASATAALAAMKAGA